MMIELCDGKLEREIDDAKAKHNYWRERIGEKRMDRETR